MCSPLVPDAAQAKVSHVSPTAGITEYVAPLQNWLAESTYSVFLNNGGNQLNPGTLMLLGDNGVAYGTNGDKLAAFDSTSGAQLWQVNKLTVLDSVTLYAATADQNNHVSVMGMDSATSQQQMQLFDGSTITASPLGLLNPDYDPSTQSWFGYSPALGAQAVVQTAQFAPQEDEWAFFQAPAGRRAAHVDVSFRQTANCSGFDGHVTDHNEEWLMVPLGGTQAAPTQGSNDVIAHANVDFGQVDFISSDTTKATVALGAINHHDITLTVTGLLKDEGTTIKAVDHQDHNTVYATLHLAIRPRIEKNLYLFSVSQQDTPQSARTLTPTRLPNATALQNLLESIYGRQANVHVTVHGDPQNNNVPISIGTNYDLNRDGRLQNDGENSPLSAEGSTLFNGIVDYYGCGAAGGNCTMDQNGYFASYVHALSQDLAIAERPGRLSITGDTHVDSTELTTAHELVHNFDIRDLCDPQMVNNVQQCIHDGSQPGPGNLTDRIAWHFDNNPGRCRLTKDEWDVINKPSGQQ